MAFDTLGPLFVKDPEKRKGMLDGIDDDRMKNAANGIRMCLMESGLGCRAVMRFAVSGLRGRYHRTCRRGPGPSRGASWHRWDGGSGDASWHARP